MSRKCRLLGVPLGLALKAYNTAREQCARWSPASLARAAVQMAPPRTSARQVQGVSQRGPLYRGGPSVAANDDSLPREG